jgi:WD40 repeat protein
MRREGVVVQLNMSSLLAFAVFSLKLAAEPGPPPRELRLDSDGDILPAGALARLGTKRFRDLLAEHVTAAPDGKSVASRGGGGIRIFDLASGRLSHAWWPYSPRSALSRMLQCTTNDGRFAVVTEDQLIELWDVKANKLLAHRKAGPWRYNHPIAISNDGTVIAFAGSPDLQGIHIWDVTADRVRVFGEHRYDLTSLRFCGNYRLVASTGSGNGETTCWDLSTGKQLWMGESSSHPICSGDGRVVILFRNTPAGGHYLLVDSATGKPDTTPRLSSRQEFRSVNAISHDGRYLAGYTNTGTGVWDTTVGEVTWTKSIRRFGPVAFVGNSSNLIALNRSYEIWDTTNDKKIGGAQIEDGPLDEIYQLRWSPDGRMLAARTGSATAHYLWDVRTARLQFQHASRFPITVVTASADPTHWITLEYLRSPELEIQATARDWRTGAPIGMPSAKFPFLRGMIVHLTEYLDGSHRLRCVTGPVANNQPSTVVDIDWQSAKIVERSTVRLPSQDNPTATSDGRFLLGEGRLFALDRLTDEPPLKPLGDRWAQGELATDAAGFLIACALHLGPDPKSGRIGSGPSDVAIYERWTGTPILYTEASAHRQFALSQDGRTIAVNIVPNVIRIMDVATGNDVRRIELPLTGTRWLGPGGTALAFSPDNTRLAVGHWDGTVIIWDDSRPATRPPALNVQALDRLWTNLADPDGKIGWSAVFRLQDSAAESISYLLGKLTKVEAMPVKEGERLIAELESPTFRAREQAAKRAKDAGDAAKAVVEAALLKNPGADLKQRLESLVAILAWSNPPIPEDLRRLRAIAVLERAGTKEARAKIDELASGLPSARVTQEAKAAMARAAASDLLKAKK